MVKREDGMTFDITAWTPLGRRLFVRRPPVPEKVGSLFLPPEVEARYRSAQGEIVAVGPEVRPPLAPGLRVILRKFGAEALADDVWAVWEHDVTAIVREDGREEPYDPPTD